MSILADWEIRQLSSDEYVDADSAMIKPYVDDSVKIITTVKGDQRILSYGVSSYGYDMRLSNKDLKVFTNLNGLLIDPRKINPDVYTVPKLQIDEDGLEYVVLPPNSGMLGHTVEWFNIPRNILGICLGKSTYVRAMVSILVTPLEPEWTGNLVVEIVNHSSSPVKIYPNQGIGQIVFHKHGATHTLIHCDISYKDRGGKYNGQKSTQDAIV